MTGKVNFDAHRAAVLRKMHDDRVKGLEAAAKQKAKAEALPAENLDAVADAAVATAVAALEAEANS